MKKLILLLMLSLPIGVLADTVVPIDKVENSVNVRTSSDADSAVVGRLEQGDSMELVNSSDGWHEVRLDNGSTGFISADWVRIVAAPVMVEETQEVSEAEQVEETEQVEEAEEVTEIDAGTLPEVVEEDIEEEVVVEVAAVEKSVGSRSDLLKGKKNFVVKFRDGVRGENSQIYDDGNHVGIGTTDPQQRLEVNGSIRIHEQNSSVAGLMITQSSGDTGYIMHNRASTLTIGAGSQDRITIDRDGNVGIAVSKPEFPLQLASGAHVTAGGVWTNSSSRSRKDNIELLSFDDASSALMLMQPVMFNYRNEPDEHYVGFIAEDVPDLVAMNDRDSLSPMDIIAVLTRVVQQQENRIKALEAELSKGQDP